MNFYKYLSSWLPDSIKKDLFFRKDMISNSLTFYGESYQCNRRRYLGDIFFRESHRFLKALVLLLNFFDRKMARLQLVFLRRKMNQHSSVMLNKKFHNRHQGQRCFVVANGPSLAKQDLSHLIKEITIATNTIWKHPLLDRWRPTYYCTAHVERFYEQQDLPDGFESAGLDDVLDYFKNVRERLPETTYFIPFAGWDANKKYNFLPENRTCYLPFLPYPVSEFLPSWPDLVLGLPSPQDSSQYAIMIAMAMGFSEIILLGCDHDWFVNIGEEKHFFAGPVFKNSKGSSNTAQQNMIDSYLFAWMVWRGHENLRRMAEARGVKIINATGGGVLDAYQLGSYEEIIGHQV